MHDPMTLAFTIPNPFTRRKVSWTSAPYYESLIEIWHVDPEKRGDDDSCDWFGSRQLTEADRDWLRKEGESQHKWFFRGLLKYDDKPDGSMVENTRNERWPGGMVGASSFEVLMGIASVIFWTMPVNGKKMHERWFSGWRLRRAMASALPTILGLCTHSSDNLHSLIAEARASNDDGEKAMGELFVAVARNLRRAARPWYKHPRWHVHHWSVTVVPWRNLRNWLGRRCADCGKRFTWGYAPVYDSRGYHHHKCCGFGVAEAR